MSTRRGVRRTRSPSTLLPLEQVNPSVGPLAFLDTFERVALETVSRAFREEVRAPVLLWRQLVISKSLSKEARLVNDLLSWLFGNEQYSCASLTSLDLKGCRYLTDGSMKAVAAGCASLTSLNVQGAAPTSRTSRSRPLRPAAPRSPRLTSRTAATSRTSRSRPSQPAAPR